MIIHNNNDAVIQEDLDSMEQELEMWKKENSQYAETLRREEKYKLKKMIIIIIIYCRITEDELTPLKEQLTELSAKIDEQVCMDMNLTIIIIFILT